ncbi:MAG TPA: energy transducer TonB [Candidatus Baltobacteraceae bacterium]|nr:energy transducer TonB [Candidatus Baltobacteraceae bacterium]
MPIASTPPCTHPPLPIHTAGVRSAPFDKMYRPYATVKAQVDANGRVVSVELDDSSGSSSYDTDAQNAMKTWTFEPASQDCKAVAGAVEYVVGAYDEYDIKDPCNHDVRALKAVAPDFPYAARGFLSSNVSVSVLVGFDEVGRLTKAQIVNSSGNMALDKAALQSALQAIYFPAVRDCAPQSAQYIYRVTFSPNG